MKQFVKLETTGGNTVVVNTATITYIKWLSHDTSMIFFNGTGNDDKPMAVKVRHTIDYLAEVLNGD